MSGLRPQAPDFKQINRQLSNAHRKLVAARKVLDVDEEACYQLAYEAMLRASLALMFSFGLRPRSAPGHHIAVIEFAGKHLGAQFSELIRLFNRMRVRRNKALYEASVHITKHEASESLEIAARLLTIIQRRIEQNNPQFRFSGIP